MLGSPVASLAPSRWLRAVPPGPAVEVEAQRSTKWTKPSVRTRNQSSDNMSLEDIRGRSSHVGGRAKVKSPEDVTLKRTCPTWRRPAAYFVSVIVDPRRDRRRLSASKSSHSNSTMPARRRNRFPTDLADASCACQTAPPRTATLFFSSDRVNQRRPPRRSRTSRRSRRADWIAEKLDGEARPFGRCVVLAPGAGPICVRVLLAPAKARRARRSRHGVCSPSPAACVARRSTRERGLAPAIKWPNDSVVGSRRKLRQGSWLKRCYAGRLQSFCAMATV
jgi:hypothetical protein